MIRYNDECDEFIVKVNQYYSFLKCFAQFYYGGEFVILTSPQCMSMLNRRMNMKSSSLSDYVT